MWLARLATPTKRTKVKPNRSNTDMASEGKQLLSNHLKHVESHNRVSVASQEFCVVGVHVCGSTDQRGGRDVAETSLAEEERALL